MLKVFYKLILLIVLTSSIYAKEASENILFVGHGYGSHFENDSMLDESLIKFSNNFSNLFDYVVLGGDFIYDCNDEKELDNLIAYTEKFETKLVIGNHDDCPNIISFVESSYGGLNYYKNFNNTLIFFLNTSLKNNNEVENLFNYFEKVISKENPNKVIIFSHQVIFSRSDFYLRVNSRKYYNYANAFYQKIYNSYYKKALKFYFVSGDIGAFSYNPYAFEESDENFHLYASGIGNKKNHVGLLININQAVDIRFIDLKSGIFLNNSRFSKINNQFYQFPKLILAFIRDNYKFLLITLFLGIVLYLYSKKNTNEQ